MDAPAHMITIDPNIGTMIWSRFLEPYLAGSEPVCHSVDLPNGLEVDAAFSAIPVELIRHEYRSEGHNVVLIEGADYAAIVQKYSHQTASVVVRSTSNELVTKAIAEITSWFPLAEEAPTAVSVDFWQSGQRMFTTSRSIDAPLWKDVGHHYPAEVGETLDELMQLELSDPDGRVILWHGPPGTGKTSAIRALARAWRSQATFQIVLDPEPVFSHSANLMQVVLNSYDSEDTNWRVLVIEDADEIVRADNAATSQSLSRLLNVGDGIVGQGLKVLVLLTTNEPPSRLHPALTRPGRCLANVAFRKFTPAEAESAFGQTGVHAGGEELSLAEILTGRKEESASDMPYGQYL